MKGGVFEKQLIQIWQHKWMEVAELASEGGQRVRVIHAGRPNTDDRGPDFCDAVVALDGRTVTGDIEIHVRSRDWQAHGHDRDPAYDRVVLHVVMWHDGGAPTRLHSGTGVPVLVLREHIRAPASVWWCDTAGSPRANGEPCQDATQRFGEDHLAAFVESAGDARFMAKAAAFREDLEECSPGQVLYQGVMMALGFSRNKLPFLELSQRLPLCVLESAANQMKDASEGNCAARLYAALLGTAGLVPGSYPDPGGQATPNARMVAGWDISPERCIPSMSVGDWHLFRVRPNNSPVVRLAAMSRLLARHRKDGLLVGLLGVVTGSPGGERNAWLEKAFLVPGIGHDRTADIIINIALPFTHAFGCASGEAELCHLALAFYRTYGRLAQNSLTRHMAVQIGLRPQAVDSARRQQGLLHIYKTLCTQGKCEMCPLSEASHISNVQDTAYAL
ncbi:MAG: hypothetical protein A2147_05655 [Chloroflexi bacterium RBG_16_57_8]|nr:MAG: hypothetical protein A2147_05655 [Chloroflexi bacterium RBG_16_57_8]